MSATCEGWQGDISENIIKQGGTKWWEFFDIFFFLFFFFFLGGGGIFDDVIEKFSWS